LPNDSAPGSSLALVGSGAVARSEDLAPQLEAIAFAERRLAQRLVCARQAQLDREGECRERLGAHSISRRS
jgi:hypothetical protein